MMLSVNNLSYFVEGRPLLEAANFTLPRGRRAALVGRNGSGKTTLLRLIEGAIQADAGTLAIRKGARTAAIAQTAPTGSATVRDTVLAMDKERTALLEEAARLENNDGGAAGIRLGEIHSRLTEIGAAAAPARAAAILRGLGFNQDDQRAPLDRFSGGWRMRVALAAALFSEPDLLLLDEPTNHLDLEASIWLSQFLARWPHTLMLVSHDRALINRVANLTVHLHARKLTAYRGGFDAFERTRRETLELDAANRKKLAARRRHMQSFVDRFRYKATKARQAQSRLKALEKLGEPPPPIVDRPVTFKFPDPAALPPPLVTLENVAAGYEPDHVVIDRLNLRLDMDDRIALLGANGNGKTTLLRVLAGSLAPRKGVVTRARRLEVGYFAQEQTETLDLSSSAYEQVSLLLPDREESRRRAHLGRFGLSGPLADHPAATLSGGEKVGLALALIFCRTPHLLLLDEPTNHLDLDARESLIAAINDFTGAIVLVTHDSELIRRCADRLWQVGKGTCQIFDGDIDDYQDSLLARHHGPSDGVFAKSPRRSKMERRQGATAARAETALLRKRVKDWERKVADLTREKALLDAAFADPALYDGPAGPISELSQRLGEVRAALEAAETTWLDAEQALERATNRDLG